MTTAVWITWDDHRRSRELAAHWSMDYVIFEYSGITLFRYIVLTVRTLKYFNSRNPKIVICQNPSVVLASLLASFASIKKFTLIVDRHSNFKTESRSSRLPKWKIFHLLSDYSLKKSNLTIVTNKEAAQYVSSRGGNPIVLPDKLPSDLSGVERKLEGQINFLFICSFSSDEPVDAVLDVFKYLGAKFHVYVTGNYKKHSNWEKYYDIENIHFVGFVSESDYVSYLNSVDATVVLTDMPMTLNCGSYESVKAGKPQVVANSSVIRDWFRQGAVYVDPGDYESILRGISQVIERIDILKRQQEEFSITIESEWQDLDMQFRQTVLRMSGQKL